MNEGGRITKLLVNSIKVISGTPSNYKKDYASAILFPFANRIKHGEYVFNNSKYKLVCNEEANKNAIHGLVYNKYFKVIDKDISTDFCSITLRYIEKDGCEGFPFKYSITVKYTLKEESLLLKITIKNDDDKSFPFTLGWHPYFLSSNLFNSKLSFSSNANYKSNKQGIVIGKEDLKEEMPMLLKNRKFDDAYVLQSDLVKFITPNYQLQLESSAEHNFLQIYTPDLSDRIAIEPMTGVSDSFNNNIGKQIICSNDDYSIEWQIKIITNTLNN
nr:aldose 1-epimerase [Winogradskyella echinorum]